MILSMVGVGLRLHALSTAFAVIVLTFGGSLAGLPIWLPGLGWGLVALSVVEGWYLVEGPVRRQEGDHRTLRPDVLHPIWGDRQRDRGVGDRVA